MGAIQNSINSVLGTAIVLAAGGKKLKSDAEALESAKTQESVTLTEAIPKLDEGISKQGDEVDNAMMALNQTKQKYQQELDAIAKAEKKGFSKGPKGQQKAAQAAARREEIGEEISKRELALKTAQGKLDAMKLQKTIYAERLAKLTGGKK